jgi:hypothetical protein
MAACASSRSWFCAWPEIGEQRGRQPPGSKSPLACDHADQQGDGGRAQTPNDLRGRLLPVNLPRDEVLRKHLGDGRMYLAGQSAFQAPRVIAGGKLQRSSTLGQRQEDPAC